MRELKFRMWDGSEIHPHYTIAFENAIDIHNESDGPDLMQWTGLKDKNGSDIYEGDILKAPGNMSYRFKDHGKVYYEPDYGGYIVSGAYSKNQHHEQLTCDVACDCEVIGNIYQNPDLL